MIAYSVSGGNSGEGGRRERPSALATPCWVMITKLVERSSGFELPVKKLRAENSQIIGGVLDVDSTFDLQQPLAAVTQADG